MALLSLRDSGGRGLAVAGEAAEAAQCSGGWDGAETHRVPEDTRLKETLRIRLASLTAAGATRDSGFPSQPTRKRRNSQRPVRSGSPANSLAFCAVLGTKHQGTMVCKILFVLCIFTAGILGRRSPGGAGSGMIPGSQHWGPGRSGETGK